MILQHVRVDVRDGQESAFDAALLEVRQRVFSSPGFRGFRVAEGMERRGAYLVEVRWESAEELADAAERFDRCWAPVEPFLARPLSVEHLVERASLAFQGPGVLADLAWLRN